MDRLVSICIPVFNGAPFIRKTLEMVLAQDYSNMEILVSDNASTDNTLEEIQSVKDPRIRLLTSDQNVGMGGNWNKLIHEAKGEYLMIVCADDYILPGAISAKASILNDHSSVNIVFSSSYVMNEEGKIIYKRRPFRKDQELEGKALQRKLFTTRNFLAEPPNIMLRRSAMLETGDFDTNLWYTIDWDYWLRMLNKGNAYYIDQPYEGFRVSKSSATGSSLSGKEKILKDEAVFLAKHKDSKLIPVTQEMIRIRTRNVNRRLQMKVLFMKLSSILPKKA